MLVFAELGSGQNNLVNLITTTQAQRERFRMLRKVTHQGVGIQQVKKYRDFQNDESKVVALDLLSTPENYVAHFERYATSVVSIIGFGRRVASHEDPIITEVIALMHRAVFFIQDKSGRNEVAAPSVYSRTMYDRRTGRALLVLGMQRDAISEKAT
jgi:hypothetical protein